MMLPVSWQIGCDFCLARSILRSMIFMADSAMVPCFSRWSAEMMAACTSSGISADVRRINSSIESCSAFIAFSSRYGLSPDLSIGALSICYADKITDGLELTNQDQDRVARATTAANLHRP